MDGRADRAGRAGRSDGASLLVENKVVGPEST